MINLEMPDDVQTYVKEYQGKMRGKPGKANYSLQKTIIRIIREHKEMSEKHPDIKEMLAPISDPED